MKEDLIKKNAEELITYALSGLINTVEKGANFVAEQTPILAQEIILFGIISNAIRVIMGIILLIVAGICIRKIFYYINKSKEENDTQYDNYFPHLLVYGVIGVFSLLIGAVNAFSNIMQLIKASFAPRLYLLEVVQKLL